MNWLIAPANMLTCPDGCLLVLTHVLFDMELYAWYVIEVDWNLPEDIDGVLMTAPFQIHGPLDTEENARTLMDDLQSGHKLVD